MANRDAMQAELIRCGVLPETAKVAVSQYYAVKNIDPLYAGAYAREIRERVTGAYERILAKYLDELSTEEGTITNNDYIFAEQLTMAIVNQNMDFIIASFRDDYSVDVAMDKDGNPINVDSMVDYSNYERNYTDISYTTTAKEYSDKLMQQVEAMREREESEVRKPKQRTTEQKTTAKKPYYKMDTHEQIQERNGGGSQEQIRQRTSKPIHEQVQERTSKTMQQLQQRTSKTVNQQVQANARRGRNRAFTNRVKSAFKSAVSAIKSFFKRG